MTFTSPYVEADVSLRVELGRHAIVITPFRFTVLFPTFDSGGTPGKFCLGSPTAVSCTPAHFFGADEMRAELAVASLGYAVSF